MVVVGSSGSVCVTIVGGTTQHTTTGSSSSRIQKNRTTNKRTFLFRGMAETTMVRTIHKYGLYESMSTSTFHRSMYSSETHMNRIQLESLDCIRAGQWRAIFLDSGAVANIVNSSTGSGCCQANREFRGEIHVLATILYVYINI